MLNRIVLGGRMTRDPELKTAGGASVANFSLAVDRDIKDKEGRRPTDFIDCVAWGNTADFVSRYFSKGSMTLVDGRLQLRDWKDKEGNSRRAVEVLVNNVYFGERKRSDDAGNDSAPAQAGATAPVEPDEDLDGELPF